MKKIYIIITLLACCTVKTNKIYAQVNKQDSLALVDLYNSTDGSNWKHHNNWLTGPVSTWFGIELWQPNGSELYVKEISLAENKLTENCRYRLVISLI